MLTKRIIPCLDIKNGRTVKGVNFVNLIDAGDPVALAKQYADVGADELVFLDISATLEGRKTMLEMVLKVAAQVNIPFTVGGGISSVEDVDNLLQSGADKVSINSSAIKRPELINELSQKFGSQCVVVAIDAKQIDGKWFVHLAGGTIPTELDLFEWAKEVEERGAGEILFTSMDHDGTKSGFANEALATLSAFVKYSNYSFRWRRYSATFYRYIYTRKIRCSIGSKCFSFWRNSNTKIKTRIKK